MNDYKRLAQYLVNLGIEDVAHSNKNYLAHLVSVYRLMEGEGCTEELCRAGMFHSIYGTALFQGFALPFESRDEIRSLLGERAERLAYLNCAMDREFFDGTVFGGIGPTFDYRDRVTGEEIPLAKEDFDDLCRIHLFDWLEQVPRSRYGWGYRRSSYRAMAERLGGTALATYDRVFAAEPPRQ